MERKFCIVLGERSSSIALMRSDDFDSVDLLGSIFRVDLHVFGREVAGPHRGAVRAAGAEIDLDREILARQVLGRLAARARRTDGRSRTAPASRSARARRRARTPRPIGRRPRRGVPSSDRRRARPSSRAASWRSRAPPSRRPRPVAAPVTVIAISLVAPSPPRTMPSASSCATARNASNERGVEVLVDRDAAGAVGQREHAVVRRRLAVDGDGVERVARTLRSARAAASPGSTAASVVR